MKKVMCLIALALFTGAGLFAQNRAVSVFSQEGEKFYLVLDGVTQNPAPQSRVDAVNLPNDYYLLKIIFEDQSIPNLEKKITTLMGGTTPADVVYVLSKNSKGEYKLKMNSYKPSTGTVAAAPNGAQTQQVQPANGATNGVSTNVNTTTTSVNTGANPNGTSMNVNVTDPNTGQTANVNMNVNIDPNAMGYSSSTTTTTTTTTTGDPNAVYGNQANNNNTGNNNYNNSNNNNSNCTFPMSSWDFKDAKTSISKQTFADQQMQIAKQVVQNHCVSTDQIKEIMGIFTFEQNKLDFAKFAYDYCTEKANYYKVNDAFTFSGSVTELTNYVNSKK